MIYQHTIVEKVGHGAVASKKCHVRQNLSLIQLFILMWQSGHHWARGLEHLFIASNGPNHPCIEVHGICHIIDGGDERDIGQWHGKEGPNVKVDEALHLIIVVDLRSMGEEQHGTRGALPQLSPNSIQRLDK